jgi:hypothetical protein
MFFAGILATVSWATSPVRRHFPTNQSPVRSPIGDDSRKFPPDTEEESCMFESQYNDEMEAEVRRLEGKQRAIAAGHPEWDNACAGCRCELSLDAEMCVECGERWI